MIKMIRLRDMIKMIKATSIFKGHDEDDQTGPHRPRLGLALVGEWLRTLQDPEIPGLPKMGWYGVAPVPDHKIGD